MSSRDMCLLPRATLHSDSEHFCRAHLLLDIVHYLVKKEQKIVFEG
jgi:hypothetical protein